MKNILFLFMLLIFTLTGCIELYSQVKDIKDKMTSTIQTKESVKNKIDSTVLDKNNQIDKNKKESTKNKIDSTVLDKNNQIDKNKKESTKNKIDSTVWNKNLQIDKKSDKSKELQNSIVYVMKSGKQYHLKGCAALGKNSIPMTVKEAKAKKYTPCDKCQPPK